MGLSASQIRYLSLTARQSDLEYQAQIINNARIALANKSSDANKAYTEGMSNKIIRVANGYEEGTGIKKWTELTFENSSKMGYQIMGGGGESLIPSPYIEYAAGQTLSEEDYDALPASAKEGFTKCEYDITSDIVLTSAIPDNIYQLLPPSLKQLCSTDFDETDGKYHKLLGGAITLSPRTSPISKELKEALLAYSDDIGGVANEEYFTPNAQATYKAYSHIRIPDPNYKGMDIQTLLVSGRGQIVSNEFFNFLCQHGYGTGRYQNIDDEGNRVETSYKDLVEKFQNQNTGEQTVIDWRSDVSNMFKEVLYTEDDAQALAEFEAATSEIHTEDQKLELQLKRLETEHKAIETEMESLKKVIDKNIENTYKTFGQ